MKTVKVENILLPKDGVDFEKWAVVACDQFTSQPEYWEKLAAYVGNAPSTLNLIFPEVYLSDNRENRIKKINENMYKYLDENVFKEIKDSFVLVERDTPYEKGRLGLMMAVDLEEYDYTPFAPVAIRATEGTVLERIPPRVEIRRHAPLELPHIMLLIDDREHTVIEPLYENREKLELLYDTNLNMNGGHVRGWRVPDTAAVLEKLYALTSDEVQIKNYGKVTNFLFAVGDGMGSGKNANDLSERAVKTIENFFEAGFSEDVVMEVSNKILTRHATGDGFSAVDIMVLNLNTGAVNFIKLGATFTVIKSGDEPEIIEGNALPMGVVENVQPFVTRRVLSENDVAVLLSDGVTDVTTGGEIAEILDEERRINPEVLSSKILDAAVKNGASDDATVLTVKIFSRI